MSGEDTMYEITLDIPGSPKGEPFQIVGLGTFENGGTYTVTKDEAETYRSHHSRLVPVVSEDDESIIGSTVELGPTLLQDSKNMHGVTVSKADADTKAREKGSNTSGDADTSKMAQTGTAVEKPDKDKGGVADAPKTQGGDK